MNFSSLLLIVVFDLVAAQGPWYPQPKINNLIVETASGTYRGLINGSAPLVREFLGIPFAKPPTGDLRWMPPQKLENKPKHVYDSTRYPPSCPQYVSKIPTVWNSVVTEYIIAGPPSEDCLALSIWTPAEAKDLPVIMFITGGGFQTGGIQINYQLPYNWVERTQAHIVVTINYRLNIFGFPNAAGLDSQNLGILDQRAALEWVRDNIKAFGGDPSRITLWGQSAGAASVDYNNFAFYKFVTRIQPIPKTTRCHMIDPIVTGFFGQSGTVLLPLASSDMAHTNFSFVASNLGCNHPVNAAQELKCMRQVSMEDIEDFVGGYSDNGTTPTIAFDPIPDEKIIYSNYTDRYAMNKVSQRPAIFSNTEEEGNSLVTYHRSGINKTAAEEETDAAFICPSAKTSQLRTQAGLKTYRYLYSGDFANVSPLPWMGPYHASDLPMLFATHQDYTNGKGHSTPFEFKVSEKMEDLLFSFMLDPHNGPGKHGWAPYSSGKMLRFAADGEVMQNVSVQSVDGGACAGLM